jgi:hypothetical protein
MSGKAIARNEPLVSLLNLLLREKLRVLTEVRAKGALRCAAIFPLATVDTYSPRNHSPAQTGARAGSETGSSEGGDWPRR